MTVPDRSFPPLAIRLFGAMEVRLHGEALPRLRSRKGDWLLALLVLRHDGPHPLAPVAGTTVDRAWLAGTLWPDSPTSAALALLRRELTDLRRALGPEAVRLRSATMHTLVLDLTGAEADVVAFDAAVARGDPPALAEAVALYRGPLLEGCTEEWVLQERQAREQAYLAALEALAAQAQARGDPVAERHLRSAVAADPLRESAQRGLMKVLAAGGNYAAVQRVYRELRELLHRELSAEPDPETQALFQQLRAEARRAAARPVPRDSPRSQTGQPPAPVGVASSLPRLAQAPHLPEGTVTFLFTDIEGSTRLWEEHPAAMQAALARHDALLHQAFQVHSGVVFKTFGDQFCAAFATVPDALAAALTLQRALHAAPWEEVGALRVRTALHTGMAETRGGDYFGPALNRVARLLEAGHGGQILLSRATQELAGDRLPEDASPRDLGEHRLKDLVRPEQIFQLVVPDLPADFPPLKTLDRRANNLPYQLTSFIGREQEMAEVKQLLSVRRLVTLTGAGGCGKTRLALQVAAEILESASDGAWSVDLAPLADPALVPQAVATALGVREEPGRPLTLTLVEFLKPQDLLMILDNCEHLVAACAQLAEALLQACPTLRILATSREPLSVGGEAPYRVPSLALPEGRQSPVLGSLMQYESVRLFVDRAATVLPTFTVTEENAPAVAQVCRRLDGIPLALELAAARVKALPVQQLAARLEDRFRLLTGGSRTALPRQQTLRATMDWSYDLLSEPERALLRRLSVFHGGWTLEAAEAVCVAEGIEAEAILDLLTALVDRSLVLYEEQEEAGRYRLLETVRQYGW
jgi:predicted ATPase/class 3 adenylate cyclase